MRENGTLTWLISDHLGSTSLTVDASGTLLSSLKYTAFGELRSGTSATDYLYTGQRQEAEIGLYFYVSRFYDPALGRFISPDTIVPGAGNPQAYDRYAYVNNNPVRYSDPTGHCPMCFGAAIGAAVGGLFGIFTVIAYNAKSGHEMSVSDTTLVVGTMALAGGLIGSGIGAAAGGEVLASMAGTFTVAQAAIGGTSVGAGVGSYAAGNVASSIIGGNEFDSKSFAVSSSTGAVQGAINTIAPAPIRIAGSAVTGGGQYIADEYAHGNFNIDSRKATNALIIGGITQGAGELLTAGGAGRILTSPTLNLANPTRIIFQESVIQFSGFVKSTIINALGNRAQPR